MKIPYIIKDIYSLNNYLVFENVNKISVTMAQRTVKFKMFSNYDQLLDSNKFVYGDTGEVVIHVNYEDSIKSDGYQLKINKNKEIIINAKNERGIRYAFNVLNNLVASNYQNLLLPIIKIDDEPSFKLRGVIEGFYGNPWSHENRLDVINFMDKYRLNAFMYAPKDDEYHRNKWRELYPEEELTKLITYKNECDLKEIDFYYCISPGKDFNYLDENDFNLLYKKLDQVIDRGINKFALLMDDIDYKLSEENKKIFKRPVIAHAYITNKINNYIKENVIEHDFIMCPTEYHQNWDSQYRNDLKIKMDADVKVFYTGDNVCAEIIDNDNAKHIKEVYDHPIVLWENYPVNDFWKSRIFLAPIINRGTNLNQHFESMVSNPMNQWHSSKIGVISIADYMWNTNKYNPEISFERALNELVEENDVNDLRVFAKANYLSVLNNDDLLTHQNWVKHNEDDLILNHYQKLSQSAKNLLKTNYPLIEEIKPWLERAIKEADLVKLIYKNEIKKEQVIDLIKEPIALGDQLFNLIIKAKKLISDEEEAKYITSLLGGSWWKVWENKY